MIVTNTRHLGIRVFLYYWDIKNHNILCVTLSVLCATLRALCGYASLSEFLQPLRNASRSLRLNLFHQQLCVFCLTSRALCGYP